MGIDILKKFKAILDRYGYDISSSYYDTIPDKDKPPRATIFDNFGDWENAKNLVMGLDDMLLENVKLAKERQHYMDSNRIERKTFRNYARIENAISEYNKELIKVIKENNMECGAVEHRKPGANNPVGILHLTDTHFNELVDLEFNKYDFTIASKRCEKFVTRAIEYFKVADVGNVLFAMTGDMLNSDRKLDELLNQATNRSKATFLATHIIKHMILHLNKYFNIDVVAVTGNESRVKDDIYYSDIIATDNYDFTIFNILRIMFDGCGGVTFIIPDDYSEQVISVNNNNILLLHGTQIKAKAEESVQKIKGKYSSRGINIRYVIFGHLHSCRIGDTYARGSSVVGANVYSYLDLQLESRASQNIYIVEKDGSIDSIKIDLQNTDGYDGYNINKEIESYNIKSADRIKNKYTVLETRI